MSNVQAVTPENFEAEVLKSDKPVIVDFWAEWCQPCKQVTPKLEALATQYEGKVKVVAVDCEVYRDWAKTMGIRSIPTIQTYNNGEKFEEIAGARVLPGLETVFRSLAS